MHECDAQALDDDRVNGQGPRQGTWQEPVSGNRQPAPYKRVLQDEIDQSDALSAENLPVMPRQIRGA